MSENTHCCQLAYAVAKIGELEVENVELRSKVADLQAENKELRERLEREEWLAVGERDGYPDYNT